MNIHLDIFQDRPISSSILSWTFDGDVNNASDDPHRRGVDNKGKGVLMMLDLYSAIDTTNHDYLMNRLQHSVGITDAALSWLHSYMTGSYQRIDVYRATLILLQRMDSRIIVIRMTHKRI